MVTALSLLFGVIVGLALGLTGGGGSVFAIPLLVFGLGMPAHEAVTLSLAAVTVVAIVGSLGAARNRLIEYRAGLIFAIAGIATAPVGVALANLLDEKTLLIAFGVLVVIVASAMGQKARKTPGDSHVVRANLRDYHLDASGAPCKFNPDSKRLRLTAPCSMVLSIAGLMTGVLSGMFGVGGGFIIVPALTFVTQLSIHRAVATSLFVIALIGCSGLFSGLLSEREIPWLIAATFVPGGIAGLLVGQQIAKRLAGPKLQTAFAVAMIVVGLVTIAVKL